ncbi:Serine/threonine-protein kinase MPS1 [Candida viswanathii]|uniref:Serine/threonine-protein kinase MPS1 n=1 Tax=Candida viswanathii TaxID=5486 RepID=A0A367YJ65_9ASCO|nr:Serine/threonine-protein kinase MPS1 [Candida viswanathii]
MPDDLPLSLAMPSSVHLHLHYLSSPYPTHNNNTNSSNHNNNGSTKRRLPFEDDQTVLPPALSAYGIQCFNERSKSSANRTKVTGKYELDFPDANKRDNTLRNKLAVHLTNNDSSLEISKSLTHLTNDRLSAVTSGTSATTAPDVKTPSEARVKRTRWFGKLLGKPRRNGESDNLSSSPNGASGSVKTNATPDPSAKLSVYSDVKQGPPSSDRFSPKLKNQLLSREDEADIMKRVEARRRELQEKELLLKREQEKAAQENLKRESQQQTPALQSPFEDNKFRAKDQPRVPLRDIPINQVDSFRKPKLPKPISPVHAPHLPPNIASPQQWQVSEPKLPAVQLGPPVSSAKRQAVTLPDRPVSSGNKRALVINGKQYEKLELLGRGGTSKVYRVRHLSNNCFYALKKVALDNQEDVNGFQGEIALLQRLRSCNRVVKLVDHAITASSIYLVMEKGDLDLAEVLHYRTRYGGPLDISFVRYHGLEMFKCLREVHDAGVVHSDLKPANFLFVKGMLKLIDFGIANAVPDHTMNIYRENQIGTPNYMAPEAIGEMSGRNVWRVGKPSDIWSIGCMLYQFIYGRPPFNGYTGLQKIMAITNPQVKIQFPTHGIGNVPVPSSAIELMQNCLHRDPNDRWTIDECLGSDFLLPKVVSESFIREIVHQSVNYGYNGRISGDGMTSDDYDSLVNLVLKQMEKLNYS